MDTINRDFAMLGMEKKTPKAECFLDVVGSDIDGSFRDSLTYL